MKQLKEFPPNYEKIKEHFGEAVLEAHQPIFTYGDTIYNPWGILIPAELEAHEETHMRQTEAAGGPEKWWQEFLSNPESRLNWECEAYAVQLKYRNVKDRNELVRQAFNFAVICASDLYGKMGTMNRALSLILKYVKSE